MTRSKLKSGSAPKARAGSVHVITGAAGFIGSHLVDALLKSGKQVIGVDNMALGRRENIAQALQNPNFTFQELDVNDPRAFQKFLTRARNGRSWDTLWHLAANSDIQAGVRDPDIDLRLTFLTTFNTLKVMQALGMEKIVFASTSAIYGQLQGALSEDSGPLFPISSYGAMKLASEGIISAALEKFLKQAWIYRFPNVVGGRATHGAIHDFLKKLQRNPDELEVLGDGSQRKPYLHVIELVDAMLFLRRTQKEKLNVFNISPENSATTVRQMAEATVKLAAPGARIRYTGGSRGWIGDVPKFRYSIKKLKRAGWVPSLTSTQAVQKAIMDNLSANKEASSR